MPGLVGKDAGVYSQFNGTRFKRILHSDLFPSRAEEEEEDEEVEGVNKMPTELNERQSVVVIDGEDVDPSLCSSPDNIAPCCGGGVNSPSNDTPLLNELISGSSTDSDDVNDSTSSFDRSSDGQDDSSIPDLCHARSIQLHDDDPASRASDQKGCDNPYIPTLTAYSSTQEQCYSVHGESDYPRYNYRADETNNSHRDMTGIDVINSLAVGRGEIDTFGGSITNTEVVTKTVNGGKLRIIGDKVEGLKISTAGRDDFELSTSGSEMSVPAAENSNDVRVLIKTVPVADSRSSSSVEKIRDTDHVQFVENSSGQRQRSLGPESCALKHFSSKTRSSCLLRRATSYPQMSKRALFIPIRASPEQSGLFCSPEYKLTASLESHMERSSRSVDPQQAEQDSSAEASSKKQAKQHLSHPPVARVNPQANPNASLTQIQQQQNAKPQQHHHQTQQFYCHQLYSLNSGYFIQDPNCGGGGGGYFQQNSIPFMFVSTPAGGYIVGQDYPMEQSPSTLQAATKMLHTSSSSLSPSEIHIRASSNCTSPQQDTKPHNEPASKHSSVAEHHKPTERGGQHRQKDSSSYIPTVTSTDRRLTEKPPPPIKRKHRTPLLPDPQIPKFSDLASLSTTSRREATTTNQSCQQFYHQPYYLQHFSNMPPVFHRSLANSSAFFHQVPFPASNINDTSSSSSSPSQPYPRINNGMAIQTHGSISEAANNSGNLDNSSIGFVTDPSGLVIYGPQSPCNENAAYVSQASPPAVGTLATSARPHEQVQKKTSLDEADNERHLALQSQSVHFPGGVMYIPDGSGSYVAVDPATGQTQVQPPVAYLQGGPYLFTGSLIPVSGEHAQTGTTQTDNSPATVRMVSSNGPPVPMPMQVPPGHMVQQIVDENGILTHVILSPQPPGPTTPLPVGPYGGPTGGSQYYTSYGGPHYAPAPPQYSHRPHPHSMSSHMHGGIPHIPSANSANCTNHVPIQSQGEYGVSPPLNSTDERTIRTRNRVRKKLQQRRVNLNDGFYHNTRPPGIRRTRVNGDNGMHGEPGLIHAPCITPENGPLDVEEENALIIQCLSSMPAPKVTDVEARSSLIQLSPPDCDCSEVDLDMYELKYELLLSDKGRDAKYKTVFCGDASEITLKDLKPATEYHLRVCALLTEELKGALTEPISFQTLQCEPDSPQPPKLMNRTKTSLSLKWNSTCENGSKITAYSLEYDQGQGDGRFYEVYSGVQRQFRATRLNASTRYVFRLAAINSLGKSPHSEEVFFFTTGSVPSQPDSPMLSEQFVYSLTISWIRRPNDDEFLLQMEDEATGHGFMIVYNGPNLSYMVRNLRRNTEYRFRLCAKNEEGPSKWSDVVCYRTLPERPQAPSKPQIKGKINPYSFRITWDPPQDSGGAEITKYIVELDYGQGYDTVYEGSEREHLFDHLLPGHLYHIRVACCSAGGRSDFSGCCIATTLPVTPGQCQAPKLQGKPKATSLHLRWGYPDYDGGAQVTNFSVQMISPDNSSREVYKGQDRDCIVAGLLPGRPYLFQVRAVNRAGAGPWSEPLEVVSGAGVPDAPRSPHVACRSAHSALVSWEEPFNNGASVTEYRLEWQQQLETPDFTLLYTGPNMSYDAKGLTPATAYTFRVQAVNSTGPSPYSPSVSCVTPPSSPSSVASIKVKVNATSALLAWREPNNNGSDIISYNILVNDRPPITIDPVTEYLLEDLQPESTYKIRIQAVNSIGVGAYSSAVKCTTKGLPPSPPRLECTLVAPGFIKLKWGEGRNPEMLTYTLEMEKEDGRLELRNISCCP